MKLRNVVHFKGGIKMPSIPLMQLPKSRSADEFESMCKDVLTNEYRIKFKRYGKNGQKQNGIDIYAQLGGEKYAVAQCKNYFSPNSSNALIKKIEKDIKDAELIPFKIKQFIVMTSMDRDLNAQNYIETINSPFAIEIWFWEDIQERVCSDEELIEKYYPHFFKAPQIPVMERNEIISNCNTLISMAQIFNEKKDYRVAYHYENDIILYNHCVEMFNAACSIYHFKDKWYIQLKEKKIVDIIEKVLKSIPDFHDATNDITGATTIYTLTNYLSGYRSDEDTERFIKNCKKIIKQMEK